MLYVVFEYYNSHHLGKQISLAKIFNDDCEPFPPCLFSSIIIFGVNKDDIEKSCCAGQ